MIIDDLQPLATPINALKPLEKNPRRGNIAAVAKSLEAFGQRKPIVATNDGTIIAGNHTYQAAIQLGWTEIAVVRVPDDDNTAKAFALADNRTGDLGSYDDEILANLLEELSRDNPTLLDATGYTPDDVENLVAQISGIPEVEIQGDPDDIPDKAPAITVHGDLWLLGEHRLLCGDATNIDDYRKLLGDEHHADCVFTDPPYNVGYVGKTDEQLTIDNDDMSDDNFHTFLVLAFEAMRTSLKDGGSIYVCHADGSGNAFRNAFGQAGFQLRQILIWVKDRFVMSRQDYNWQHEPIMYAWKDGAAHTWTGPFNLSTVLDDEPEWDTWKKDDLLRLVKNLAATSTVVREQRPHRNAEHPTMKPISLVTRLVGNSTKPGQIILDPFSGSGSTIIGAHMIGRRGFGIELDPTYCDVICARFQQLTGIKPIAAATGREHDFSEKATKTKR